MPIDGLKHIDQTDLCYLMVYWFGIAKTRSEKLMISKNIVRKCYLLVKIYMEILIMGIELSVVINYESKSYHDTILESN